MNSSKNTAHTCDQWLDILSSGEKETLSPEQEKHLSECAVCREELNHYGFVWEALAMNVPEIDEPEGLKEEVMKAIFGDEYEIPDASLRKTRFGKRWTLIGAACLIGFGLFGYWSYMRLDPAHLFMPGFQAPYHAERQWSIISFDTSMPDVKGTVSLVRKGNTSQIVLMINGLQPNIGQETYQLWLIHGQQRYDCGSFQVSKDGKGMLIYQLSIDEPTIDAFGITLEPNPDSAFPRGKKVAGSV